MRVIAGTVKGRRLKSPLGSRLRPTSDRLRETLFNILGRRVEGARVLDACAGTGALGIEALSRGATAVVFVDQDRDAVALIIENLALCRVEGQSTVVRDTLPLVVGRHELTGSFDIILVDPPYDDPKIGDILSSLTGRLLPGGILVLERSKRITAHSSSGLRHVRRVGVGDSVLDFYERSEGPSEAAP